MQSAKKQQNCCFDRIYMYITVGVLVKFTSAVLGGVTLLGAYIPIYCMVKTIRVSEEYHEWLNAHKEEDETMEEALRRMTRGPHPDDVAGLLTGEEAEDAKEAVGRLRGRDRDRLDAARSAFESGSTGE